MCDVIGPRNTSSVIFCDENRIRVRILVVEAMNEDFTHGNVAHGGGSVHVWGGISHMEKNLLVRYGSDVTGAVYRRVLEDHLVSHGRASPLEMCAVSGLARRGARSYVWRVTTVPVCLQ